MGSLTQAELQYMEEHANDNKQPNLIATCALCLFFPCVGVSLRFIARWRAKAGYQVDDRLILGALVGAFGLSLCILVADLL